MKPVLRKDEGEEMAFGSILALGWVFLVVVFFVVVLFLYFDNFPFWWRSIAIRVLLLYAAAHLLLSGEDLAAVSFVVRYVLLLIFFIATLLVSPHHPLKRLGFVLLILGFTANFTVMAANHWKMPVNGEEISAKAASHITEGPETRLTWLDDWIRTTTLSEPGYTVSIGDVSISVGGWLAAIGVWLAFRRSRSIE